MVKCANCETVLVPEQEIYRYEGVWSYCLDWTCVVTHLVGQGYTLDEIEALNRDDEDGEMVLYYTTLEEDYIIREMYEIYDCAYVSEDIIPEESLDGKENVRKMFIVTDVYFRDDVINCAERGVWLFHSRQAAEEFIDEMRED